MLGGVSDCPLRLTDAESLLVGRPLGADAIHEVADRYAAACDPLPDVRGSADYKRRVAAVYVRRATEAAAQRAGLLAA